MTCSELTQGLARECSEVMVNTSMLALLEANGIRSVQ